MTETERAVDDLWNAVALVMKSLKDSGADEEVLARAVDYLESSHQHLSKARQH